MSRGEEVVITSNEKLVARIGREGRPSLDQVRRAVTELRALRQELVDRGFKPLTDKEIREAINAGRR